MSHDYSDLTVSARAAMTDDKITPDAVERFDLGRLCGMIPNMNVSEKGQWVRASDYDALAARLAEVEAENTDLREGLAAAYLAGSYDAQNKLKAARAIIHASALAENAAAMREHRAVADWHEKACEWLIAADAEGKP
jgi:hypothetical protein